MTCILCIETSTKVCSVAVVKDGAVVALREDGPDQYSHAEKLNVFIKEAMDSAEVGFKDLDAIAVSEGPGSYTGLRIGASAAKGLAYGLHIPVIAVNTLEALATRRRDGSENTLVIPMIDARRMEVFCAGFDGNGLPVFDTRAEILTEQSFPEAESFARVIVLGDGADKAEEWAAERGFELKKNQNASARDMAGPAQTKLDANVVVDTAYFEPFYLKDFVAGKKKKR